MKSYTNILIFASIALAGCSIDGSDNVRVSNNPPTPKQLQINRFVGFVDTIPATSGQIEVSVVEGYKLAPKISNSNGSVLVEGALKPNSNFSCSSKNGQISVKIDNVEYQASDLPHLKVALPKDKSLGIWASTVIGNFGDVNEADISIAGCGDLKIGNIANNYELNVGGSGNVFAGDVGGNSEINIGGSGNAKIGASKGSSEINIGGSGSAQIAKQFASLEANIAGSGDVAIGEGGGDFEANIVGSGSVNHRGYVNNPNVNIVGSGSVNVREVRGQPSVSKIGSGSFNVKY